MTNLATGLGELVGACIAVLITSACLVVATRAMLVTRHSALRFRLFAVRDRLTMMVAERKLSASLPLYIAIAEFVDATLERTHDLGVWDYANFVLNNEPLDPKSTPKIEQELSDLPIETRKELLDAATDALSVSIEIMRRNSFFVRVFHVLDAFTTHHRHHPATVEAYERLTARQAELTIAAGLAAA